MQQNKNLLTFLVLAIVIIYVWMRFTQPPPGQEKPPQAPAPGKTTAEGGKPTVVPLPPEPPGTPAGQILSMGPQVPDASGYQLGVKLDPHGAGVRSVVLNRFRAADEMGRPTNDPLELVPEELNKQFASYLLYAYDVRDPDNARPLDTLGHVVWKVLGDKVVEQTLEDNRKQQRVSFQAEFQGFEITKTYTLTEGEYHLGLEVKLKRTTQAQEKGLRLRYQLTGAHGLPIEGRWYTGTFRNALIARVEDRGKVERDFQDIRQINLKLGGDKVPREPGKPIRYAGVAVQYFTACLIVDDKQINQGFLDYARPTLEAAVAKGQIKSIEKDGSSFVLVTPDRQEEFFYVRKDDRERFLQEVNVGSSYAVIYHTASYNDKAHACRQIATKWSEKPAETYSVWEDDITVRVVTDAVEVKPGEEVVHKYLLYHGPVKVSQLYGMPGVSSELVDRYHDTLHLNTLTDYQSPGGLGTFASTIGFTWVVIGCTNVIHSVLGIIHSVVWSYGLDIILLTVLVRGLMFPISRKQQLMTFKMQQLAPELKKLQEKYKDDRQALGMEQMALYRKHGVNPFGTCWFLLLQMPIFMGLYYALQESIHFRLEPFWPTWIPNLAAPDMLWRWGEGIPWISEPSNYGGFFYLGPYFNLLPVIAVVLMVFQQKMLTPPPTDEQQAMQMKIMRYMMIFFGLMFYKVAAGLCIYFIASSVWGFAERKWLLPKLKPATDGPVSADALLQRMTSAAAQPPVPAGAVQPAGGNVMADRGRRRDRQRSRRGSAPSAAAAQPGRGLGGWWRERRRRWSEWWADLLEQARKK
jgi:YidC/Oxa1 family membrane protein insertase